MVIEPLFRRSFPAVMMLLVGAAAYLQASGVSHFVGATLAVDARGLLESGPSPARAAGAASTESYHRTTAAKIIERNPFDSTVGNLDPPPAGSFEPADEGGLPPVSVDNPYAAPPCEGLRVLAAAVSDDASWSFASMAGSKEDGAGSKLVRQGSDYAGKKVWFIRWDRVWLIGPGAFCQVEMFAPPPPAASASASAQARPGPAPPGSAVPEEIRSKIKKVGPGEVHVDRGAVDKILENPQSLVRSVRVTPEMESGKTVGVRLFGVRPDSLLGLLGLENGDRLEKINGFEMGNPEALMTAYARLRVAERLTVQLQRGGKPTTLDVQIR